MKIDFTFFEGPRPFQPKVLVVKYKLWACTLQDIATDEWLTESWGLWAAASISEPRLTIFP